ncbi:YidC/Oxa1 family membrane protein insertase [Sciscionella marina]|uniref:YidC/Oxa1 family membrane protein insertase n=1 Tax=Sciscionella marina TaxID=508770 RepID=UPI0003600E32|nr:YidC/Oxa1 family membrane protein insertase [Sciscionella marina]
MLSFLDPIVRVAAHALSWLVDLLTPILPAAAPGLAVVLFTLAFRLLLHPLARMQVRGERARAALAPKLRALQAEHTGDREKQAAATMALYREHGASPLAGCGPTLLQLPVFSVLYRTFTVTTIGGAANELLGHTVFGTALGAHFDPANPVFWGLLACLAVTAGCSSLFAARQSNGQVSGVMAKLVRVLPFGTLFFALFVPLAAGIYLLTTTAWTVAERWYLHRQPSKSLLENEKVVESGPCQKP